MAIDDAKFGELKEELEAIKKLFIMILLKNGVSQLEIANALGVNQSTISRMVPKGRKNDKSSVEVTSSEVNNE